MKEYRKTPEYRAWLEAQYPTRKFKVRMAVAQRTYAATPNGHLRINYLHYRRYHRLHGLAVVTFDEYLETEAK